MSRRIEIVREDLYFPRKGGRLNSQPCLARIARCRRRVLRFDFFLAFFSAVFGAERMSTEVQQMAFRHLPGF